MTQAGDDDNYAVSVKVSYHIYILQLTYVLCSLYMKCKDNYEDTASFKILYFDLIYPRTACTRTYKRARLGNCRKTVSVSTYGLTSICIG